MNRARIEHQLFVCQTGNQLQLVVEHKRLKYYFFCCFPLPALLRVVTEVRCRQALSCFLNFLL